MMGEENRPMPPQHYSSKPRQSPIRLVIVLTLSIFIIETFSHTLTNILWPVSRLAESIFDSVLLIALLSPVLYFYVLRPFNRSLAERERAEEASSKLAAIVESSDDAIIGVGLDSNIVSWNAGAERIYGYSLEEVRGRSGSILAPPDRTHEIPEIMEKIKRGEHVHHFETIRVRKDGKQIHVSLTLSPIIDGRGKMIGVSAIARDITGRKLAEEALRESEERYRGLFEASRDGIVFTNTEGWIQDANPAYCEMVGYELTELRQMTYKQLTPPQWQALEQAVVRDQISKRGYCDEYEKEYIRKDGGVFPISIRVWAIKNGEGRTIGMWAIVRDITERKRTLKELQQRTMDLEAANRELEAFTYSASHDLRSPLIGIGGLSRLLAEKHSDGLGAKGKDILHTIQKEAERMTQLVDDLLSFSRFGRQALQLSDIDMNKLARNVIDELKLPEAGETLKVNVKPLPPARGDQVMIRQVFVNLLSNAAKFTRTQRTAAIEIGGKVEDGGNIYYVRDNGVGFDPADAETLFEVFKRGHSSQAFDGTGVGLAIVKRIVERHCGRVWAEGKLNEGATFYFSLPFFVF
jgi:PAS domain S-box-containing protein